MPTQGPSGRTYGTGFRRGRERPEKWALELRAPAAVDRSRPRSLARFFLQPPFDQGGEGSCTANSGCLVAMACAAVDGVTVPVLSRSWMYYRERQILGTFPADSGADVIDEFDVDSRDGNIAEDVWPYDANPGETPPAAAVSAQRYRSVAAYQPIAAGAESTIDAILTALDNNQPVPIGLAWCDAFTAAYEAGRPIAPAMYAEQNEGHAITIKLYTPPTPAYPLGIFTAQGSWGPVSPPEPSIHPDSRAGDHYIDARLLLATAGGRPIVSDLYAAVPMASPATLTLTLSGPKSVQAGQAAAFSATLVGLPPGSDVAYAWDFGDGTPAESTSGGATASHVYARSGNYTVTGTASVASTGAKASATLAIAVTPAPAPPCRTQTDAAYGAQLAAVAAAQKQGDQLVTVAWLQAVACVLTWSRQQTDAALSDSPSMAVSKCSPDAVQGLPQPPVPSGTVQVS
jgi:hypothetical protein